MPCDAADSPIVGQDPELTASTAALLPLLDQAVGTYQEIGRRVQESLHPPAGSYALFHHLSHLIERLGDVKVILTRMGRQRLELTRQFQTNEGMSPPNIELSAQMKLDLETLYIFCNLV